MHSSEGIKVLKSYIFLVRKNLYGLKQLAYKWNQKYNKRLKLLGFKRAISDLYIYIKIKNGVIIDIYINNLLILAFKNKQHVNDIVKHNFNKLFAIKDFNAVKQIFSIYIIQNRYRRTVYIN